MGPYARTLVLLVGGALTLVWPRPALATHVSARYQIDGTVRDNVTGFEVAFRACLHFNPPSRPPEPPSVPGDLKWVVWFLNPTSPASTILLSWRHQDMDAELRFFQAVIQRNEVRKNDILPLMMFGGFKGALVGGQGMADHDITFEFLGVENPQCAPPR